MNHALFQRIGGFRCHNWWCHASLPFLLVVVATWVSLVFFTAIVGASETLDEIEGDADGEHRSGLIATLRDAAGNQCVRVDERIAFNWGTAAPDPRIHGEFRVQWNGYLLAQLPGKHRLHLRVSGKAQLRLRNQVVLDAADGEPTRWYSTSPIELPFGWHPLELEFEKTSSDASIQLFWTGPGFGLEPVSPRFLFHDSQQAVSDRFERGRQLVSALRCAACHQIPGARPALPAPDLARVKGNVHHDWLVDWLATSPPARSNAGRPTEVSRRMPEFVLDRDAGHELAAYLASVAPAPLESEAVKGEAAKGQRLFLSLGCLACHRWQTLGQESLFDGGDLSEIARKRPAHFFARWLADPASLNRRHRMPTFELTDEERGHLAVFLTTLKRKRAPASTDVPKANEEQVVRGKERFQRQRCGACHIAGGQREHRQLPPISTLSAKSAWKRSCVGKPSEDGARPGYQLSPTDQQAVQLYISQLLPVKTPFVSGKELLVEHNCLACHARGVQLGLAAQLPAIAERHRELASLIPAMAPPSLSSVGDKLVDAALLAAILQKSGNRRPWLAVRMPRFPLNTVAARGIQQHLIEADRIPDQGPGQAEPSPAIPPQTLALAGPRLVTQDGFGCTSCHQVGKVVPPAAPLNARGPDLTQLSQRIRRTWFDRFVPNPTRIVPRMEMPSVRVAVRGVLHDRIDRQLAAVWEALNRPGFQPPQPNPVRVLRRSGIVQDDQSAVFLTDVLQVDGRQILKPFAIGLSNRHNFLFDLEQAQLSSWRLGDVARQRTKGKTWFWEAAGLEVMPSRIEGPDLEMRRQGKAWQATPNGQFLGELDSVEYVTGGLEFRYRLRFLSKSAADSATLRVAQRITAQANTRPAGKEPSGDEQEWSGFRRVVEIAGCRTGDQLSLQLVATDSESSLERAADGREILLSNGMTRLRAARPFEDDGTLAAIANAQGIARFVVDYQTSLPVDQFPELPRKQVDLEPVSLQVVPGFRTTRLPLNQDLMPTGLAWRPNGTLIVTSLKGRVWSGTDRDGDGLEDHLQPLRGEWAAPFGVAAADDFVDVINKWGLVRLFDREQDGVVEKVETLASGWGHTADYHDWTVGLVKDRHGNYFVATSCQQDERSEVAAHWRGMVLKLVPRTATIDRPHRFDVLPVTGGHRFPIGIAQSKSGDIFVTDNQGHYNPFNELNHVISGARYGFINRIERKPNFQPPLTPPAIDIPHPWTRSVNGICFLDSPKAGGAATQAKFGPFEGHLVGCEYDTRRLIRMSLQRVGDTIQGAAYPFTFVAPKSGEPLLGPLTCAVSPQGDLYVGCIRDSGWGGANNIGTLVRLRLEPGKLPVGVAEVRAVREGFEIVFTGPVDRELAADKARYAVSSFTRISTPTYGGPDRQRRSEVIQSIQVDPAGRRVRLQLAEMREGFVYEFHLQKLVSKERLFFPDEAYYTLRKAVR